MKQVISIQQSILSSILRILARGSLLSLMTACGDLNVFLAVQKIPPKISNIELDNEGHFAISLKKESRLEKDEIEFYIQKQSSMPATALAISSSINSVSGMAFEATQIESALAPSKTIQTPSGVTKQDSWTYPETIDSNLYYLIEVKTKQKSIKSAKTLMIIARAALAPVQGVTMIKEGKVVTIKWAASPYATSYVIYRDEERKQILGSSDEPSIRFDSGLMALPEKIWIEARRGSLASRVLSPTVLTFQESDDAIVSNSDNSVMTEDAIIVLLNSVTGVAFTRSFSPTTSVSFSWNASTDPRVNSYGVKICSSANCSTSCSGVVSKNGLSHSLTGVDGSSYFACVRGEDGLGNYSNFVHSSNPITIDTIAPTTSSVSIADGAEYIRALATTLTLSSIAADEMYITENSSCSSGGTWEAYSNSKVWTFTHSNAGNSIYVKYRDYAGNESPCVTDTVLHDNQSPSAPSVVINVGDLSTVSTSVSLTLSASDSSPLEVYVTNDAGCGSGGSWEGFRSTRSWELKQTEGNATVYVRFRDAAFNLSACVSDDILHDSSIID